MGVADAGLGAKGFGVGDLWGGKIDPDTRRPGQGASDGEKVFAGATAQLQHSRGAYVGWFESKNSGEGRQYIRVRLTSRPRFVGQLIVTAPKTVVGRRVAHRAFLGWGAN